MCKNTHAVIFVFRAHVDKANDFGMIYSYLNYRKKMNPNRCVRHGLYIRKGIKQTKQTVKEQNEERWESCRGLCWYWQKGSKYSAVTSCGDCAIFFFFLHEINKISFTRKLPLKLWDPKPVALTENSFFPDMTDKKFHTRKFCKLKEGLL